MSKVPPHEEVVARFPNLDEEWIDAINEAVVHGSVGKTLGEIAADCGRLYAWADQALPDAAVLQGILERRLIVRVDEEGNSHYAPRPEAAE